MPSIQLVRERPTDGKEASFLFLEGTDFKWSLILSYFHKGQKDLLVDFPSFLALFLIRLVRADSVFKFKSLIGEAKNQVTNLTQVSEDLYWIPCDNYEITPCEDVPELDLGLFKNFGPKFPVPVLISKDGREVVTGLCAVLREILVQLSSSPDEELSKRASALLGFRKGCLSAPAQASPWARFCESDAPAALRMLREAAKSQGSNGPPVSIPAAFARLEEHLKHPIRVHNVRRKKQDICRRDGLPIDRNPDGDPKDWKNISERFVEGCDLTLADVMLFVSCHLSIYCLNRSIAKRLLPRCNDWVRRVSIDERFKEVIPLVNEASKDLPKLCSVSIHLPEVPSESLYKRDPERYNPRKRIFTRQGKLESVFEKLTGLTPINSTAVETEGLPWDQFPSGVNLVEEHLPAERLERKRLQVENMVAALKTIVKPGDKVVEFCCGSGHLGLIIAHVFPDCQVILLDSKQQSLDRAAQRAREANLTNVAFCFTNLEHFRADFNVGVALHACGSATDLVLNKCWQSGADFVVSPCCYGAISFVKPSGDIGDGEFSFSYPQSEKLSEVFSYDDYLHLAHASDQTHEGGCKDEQGRKCMSWADSDRLWASQERSYATNLMRMVPPGCSTKDHVLVGTRR